MNDNDRLLKLVHSNAYPRDISYAPAPKLVLIKGGLSEDFKRVSRVGPNGSLYSPNPQDPVYRR